VGTLCLDNFSRCTNIMRIVVKSLIGRSILVDIDRDNTVMELMVAIESVLGYPPDQQRLLYNGRQMREESTMDDCRVEEDSVVHVVLKLRGGARTKYGARRGPFWNGRGHAPAA
jgi:ubiquitin-small subunit ribosomal protein S27Ae